MSGSDSEVHVLRLKPGQDVKVALVEWVSARGIQAAAVISAVGSLTDLCLRLANASVTATRTGPFEIVSLSGTLSPDGVHLHLAAADDEGATIGGHVMAGCVVHTTLELVILEPKQLRLRRVEDPETGYPELVVEQD